MPRETPSLPFIAFMAIAAVALLIYQVARTHKEDITISNLVCAATVGGNKLVIGKGYITLEDGVYTIRTAAGTEYFRPGMMDACAVLHE